MVATTKKLRDRHHLRDSSAPWFSRKLPSTCLGRTNNNLIVHFPVRKGPCNTRKRSLIEKHTSTLRESHSRKHKIRSFSISKVVSYLTCIRWFPKLGQSTDVYHQVLRDLCFERFFDAFWANYFLLLSVGRGATNWHRAYIYTRSPVYY